MLYFYTAPD